MNKRLYSWLSLKGWSLFQRYDLVRFMESLARREPGAGYAARAGPAPPAFADQAEVARLAVDLAERSLAERGEPVGRRELETQAALISCRYDAGLHQMLRASAVNAVAGLFGDGTADLEKLFLSRDARELANLPRLREARREGRGVVYLINHSSHWDEFIFDVFLDIHGLGLPLFAAGQNMMATPSLGKLLMIGSYVILRAGASRAYLSTLFHFCQALSEMGKSQGIFLEAWSGGARTRDGSLRYPRRLITLQGALAARNDTFVQPVVLSYSRVPEDQGLSEGRSLASWLNGHRLVREFLKRPWDPLESLFRGLRGLYGRTYVGLGRGRLASELAAEMEQRREGGQSALTLDEYASLFAIREIARDKKIMTIQVAARAFSHLKKTRNLAEAAARAVTEARDYHRRTFGQDPDFEDYFQDNSLAEALEDGLESLAARRVIRRSPLSRWTGRPPRVLARHCLAYYATHGDRRLYSPSARENFVVCGSEPWGLALVSYLGRRTLGDKKYNNSSLTLYDREEKVMTALADDRTPADLPDHRLPKNVFPTHDHTAAFRKATEVVVAVPPQRMEETLALIMTEAKEMRSLIIASRGFDPRSHRLTMQIAWEAAVAAGRNSVNILALNGPFTPEALLRGDEAGGLWTLAGGVRGGRSSEAILLRFGKYRVTVSPDPIGVQMAAALADAYALYAALRERRHRPEAAESGTAPETAAFLREISAEAKSLALALGGQPQTFEADNPAWLTEYLIRAALRPAPGAAWLAALKNETVPAGGAAHRELTAQWPDPWANGYFSTHSAYITAKHLSLNLPHLEEADRLMWQN